MKEYAHPGAKERRETDIHSAIENVIAITRNKWKHVADVVRSFDPLMPAVPIFPNEFNQTLLNLIVNAGQAIAALGDGDDRGKGVIAVTTRFDTHWAEVSIRDTGTGIAANNLNRVFEKFFTTKRPGEGTGQGLAMAYSFIVNLHRGRLTVESEPGHGALFTISLPLRPDVGDADGAGGGLAAI